MRLWCYKNKYLIFTILNQGLLNDHDFGDCHQCLETACEFPQSIRQLPNPAIRMYADWLITSPTDLIAYYYKFNIGQNKEIDEPEYKALKLLLSLPPKLHARYWTKFFQAIIEGGNTDKFISGEFLEELIKIAETNYEDWDASKPYWESSVRLKYQDG